MGRNTPRTSALARGCPGGDETPWGYPAYPTDSTMKNISNGLEFRYFLEFDPSGWKENMILECSKAWLIKCWWFNHEELCDSIMKSLGVVCDISVSVYKIRGDLPSGMMVSVATFSPWLARDWTWKNHIPKGCFFWGGRGYPMMTEVSKVSKVSHRLVTWSK